MKKIKNIIEGIIMGTLLLTSFSILLFMGVGALIIPIYQIPIAIISAGTLVVSGSRLQSAITGNVTSRTIFSVTRKGTISQNSYSHPLLILKLLLTKNKQDSFKNECFKMFKQLNKCNSKGEIIEYKTESHGKTYKYLKRLQEDGYITNLHHEEIGKKSFLKESILFGNTNVSKNKNKCYRLSFNLTDKKIDKEYIKNFSEKENVTTTSNNNQKNNTLKQQKINQNNNGLSRQQQIEELINLRNTLNDSENINKKQSKM